MLDFYEQLREWATQYLLGESEITHLNLTVALVLAGIVGGLTERITWMFPATKGRQQ